VSDVGTHTTPLGFDDATANAYHADELADRATRAYTRRPGSRTPGRPPRPAIERFMGFVSPEPNTGCWLWLSGHDADGYAQFFEGRGPGFEQRAHRFAYKHFVGPIPDGLVLDHLCRNRGCVNPKHLEPVTNRENILRGHNPLRDRTHCLAGHPFDEANTYRPKEGGRKCRRCHAERERARRAAA